MAAYQTKRVLFPFLSRRVKNALKDSFLKYPLGVFRNIYSHLSAERFYGQTAEDALLMKLLPEKTGMYIDIGSGHPIKHSNTWAFYQRGWKGVCADPITTNFHLFKFMRRRDTVLNVLVGDKADAKDFWIFEPYGLSTSDPIVASEVMNIKDVRLLEKVSIPMVPLNEILQNIVIIQPCLLSVDVEGLDLLVLKSNDWNTFRPDVICVENWRQNSKPQLNEVESFLNSLGYTLHAFTGLSEIYVLNR
jgi:FkbM family methyltransferase